ncbi:uncharacterized protein MELLADRAFT_105821 [Melampsora larici-populina 98AG31]|uniref:Secreted protein n=1 Tax=Melampsora larici-populina (strain 98AG31 / pathotype 3-4-7) TaxID=747676 RepID=F4RJG1_MELLP|nr:uncharacterized protein MELLADRAFT_105821 [Melampsora larici-populina 98AG31]EGG07304.1 hypothetical protein MELLADRAFT_105821 [Melampsora larici-populina 98AG31]
MKYLALSSYLFLSLVVVRAHNISSADDATTTLPADAANYTSLSPESIPAQANQTTSVAQSVSTETTTDSVAVDDSANNWSNDDTTAQNTSPADAGNNTSLQGTCVAANMNDTAVNVTSYEITYGNDSVQDVSNNALCSTTVINASFSDWEASNLTTTVEVNQTLTHQVMNHTLCYNYFLEKDGCVQTSTDRPCSSNTTSGNTANYIGTFETRPSRRRLGRRYDSTNGSLSINGGDGICGPYNTDTTSGVCLWSGSNWVDGSDPQTAGWLNGAATGNCGKQVYIQRQNQPETVQYAPVLDGCNFWTRQPEVGCFQIWMTKDLFDKFSPTEEESQNLLISSTFTWDFDNLHGQSPQNAPL